MPRTLAHNVRQPTQGVAAPACRAQGKPESGYAKQPKARRTGLLRCVGGVADGTRTRDDRNHNPGLYQLSYSHRRVKHYSRSVAQGCVPRPGRGSLITTL